MPTHIGIHAHAFGATVVDAATIRDAIKADSVARLQAQQVRVLRNLGYTGEILAVLDTTDKGGPHRKAKRWFRWYVPTAAAQAAIQRGEFDPRELSAAILRRFPEPLKYADTPVPDVCTARWKPRDWADWARNHPAPSR